MKEKCEILKKITRNKIRIEYSEKFNKFEVKRDTVRSQKQWHNDEKCSIVEFRIEKELTKFSQIVFNSVLSRFRANIRHF